MVVYGVHIRRVVQNHTNTLCLHGIFGREITHIRSYTVYIYAGLARTIQIHCVYTVFWQGNHQHTVVYGVHIRRVGQNHISAPYITVCMVISLLKIPCTHCIYLQNYGSDQPYIHGKPHVCVANP